VSQAKPQSRIVVVADCVARADQRVHGDIRPARRPADHGAGKLLAQARDVLARVVENRRAVNATVSRLVEVSVWRTRKSHIVAALPMPVRQPHEREVRQLAVKLSDPHHPRTPRAPARPWQKTLALQLLKLRLRRRPPDLRGNHGRNALAVLRPDAIEPRDHVAPEMRMTAAGVVDRADFDAAQECDVLLPWLPVDTDALDQDGLEPRATIVALTLPGIARLRTVLLPSDEHGRSVSNFAPLLHI